MVAMRVLEARAEMRESSSLSPGTILKHIAMLFRGSDHKESSVFQYDKNSNMTVFNKKILCLGNNGINTDEEVSRLASYNQQLIMV